MGQEHLTPAGEGWVWTGRGWVGKEGVRAGTGQVRVGRRGAGGKGQVQAEREGPGRGRDLGQGRSL